MKPAWSVILLTSCIGAGQGLFLALFALDLAGISSIRFTLAGVVLALLLLAAGLVASFFHLGRPERAWRSAARWRTSWLSREVIVLPAFMATAAAWGAARALGLPGIEIGAGAALLAVALFVCTGMIYACLPFLQEWHTPLTVVNYTAIGCASGLTAAAALAAVLEPAFLKELSAWAIALTAAAGAVRGVSLVRNARLRGRSSLQTAIGVRHPRIEQKAQGAMGGSFNTREFFHGRSPSALRAIRWGFPAGAFAAPAVLLALGRPEAAFAVQFAGVLAERWFFFAEARHPQNLYYRFVS